MEAEYKKLYDHLMRGKFDEYIFQNLYKGGDINVKDITGKNIKIKVRYTDTVDNLRKKIQDIEGIPKFQQKLIFGTKRLNPHRTLFHYKIPIGGVVYLALNFKPKLSWRPEDKKDINEDQFMIQEHLNNLFKN